MMHRAPSIAPELEFLSPPIGPGSLLGDPFLGPKKVLKGPSRAALAYSVGLSWAAARLTPKFFPGEIFENQTAILPKIWCNGKANKLHYIRKEKPCKSME